MKKMIFKTKYIWLVALGLTLASCSDDDNTNGDEMILPALTAGEADFSKYVAVGASFSAGFTDNALFIAAQQNSFPNTLSQQFALVGGGSFGQPLMNDNIGGFLLGGNFASNPRLYLYLDQMATEDEDLTGPYVLGINPRVPSSQPVIPTTEITTPVSGPFNNYGIPGAKSFHLGFPGYGMLNPYFGRMASSASATVIGDAVAQNATFFTLSEIGGNDVLSYATGGGYDSTNDTNAIYQEGNLDPSTYGPNDITDPNVFAASFSGAVDALTANGAKGVVANVPYITSLAHFTTVPYNPLDPSNPDFGPQIPTLNTIFGALNGVFEAVGESGRAIVFSETEASAVIIKDETLTDISATIEFALNSSPTFPAFIGQFGLPPAAAPMVANLLGQLYGQCRQANEGDLFVLPSSSVIGQINSANATAIATQLITNGIPPASAQQLAGMFSLEGITYAMDDKWVLIPAEQQVVMTATDAYNATIEAVAANKGLALVDFKSILQEASTSGYPAGDFVLNTTLVTGGLCSLDGVHLTARGYAAMANAILIAIDETYGSNFEASGNLVNVGNYPTNYPPTLQ